MHKLEGSSSIINLKTMGNHPCAYGLVYNLPTEKDVTIIILAPCDLMLPMSMLNNKCDCTAKVGLYIHRSIDIIGYVCLYYL